MEFLDPKKRRAHLVRLFIGYALIATALILTVIILLYRANGFGFQNGQVIQNGLVFVSSTPDQADIYVNGQKRSEQTNVRLLMPAGQYTFELKRSGYNSWRRAINIEGGAVSRFDYPLLIPSRLTSTVTKKYAQKPSVIMQSPDRRWLLVQGVAAYNSFDVFDLTKPEKEPVVITLPEALATLAPVHGWEFVEWSNDNRHVLLRHTGLKDGKPAGEYIMLDREDPEKSVNLTTTLGINPTELWLQDKKYDKYFMYTAEDKKLAKATLAQPRPELLLEGILDFKTYGEDVILYATDRDAPAGKTLIKLREGNETYTIRAVAAASPYMLELAKYDSKWFVAAGAASENRTYIYKNPQQALHNAPSLPLVPVQILKTPGPVRVSFSGNARFIMTQNGQQFAVYDAEYDKSYTYAAKAPVDAAQPYVSWMDGHHLSYVSGGKALIVDYDNTNQQALVVADPAYKPVFDRDSKNMYTLAAQSVKDVAGKDLTEYVLSSTPLRAPADR